MLRRIKLAGFVLACCAASALVTAGLNRVSAQDAAAVESSNMILRHVVFFGFKDTATPEQIKKVEEDFAALQGKIDVIQDYEWGTNVSPENLDQGHTHCFFLTFNDAEGRDAYLVHPDHKVFGASLGPVLEKVTVIDYWTEKK